MNAIAFIFARGGSKGLPGKNIRPFAGKPLIAWAVEHAKAVKRIRRVIVSTDNEAIAKVALEHGGEVPFMRPGHLAEDNSNEWMAWRHALEFVRQEEGSLPQAMVSVPATAPLRHPLDIENCLDAFAAGGVDIVVTVTKAKHNPYFNMVKENGDGTVGLVIPTTDGIYRRQVAPNVYDMATVAYVADPIFVLNQKSIFTGRVKAVKVALEHAIDIDSIHDFKIAEFFYRNRDMT